MTVSVPSTLRVLLPLALLGCGATDNRPVHAGRTATGDARTGSPGAEGSGPASDPDGIGPAPGEAGDGLPAVPSTGFGIVALVAGRPLYVSDLFEAWLHTDSPGVHRLIEKLVVSRLVVAEAGRLGIEVSAERREQALAEVHERMQREVDRTAAGLSIEEYIAKRLGLDPRRYLDRLEEQTAIDLLAGLVVRAWLLESERAELRVIVVDQRENTDIVQARLAKGDDFGELAGEYSVKDSAARSGRIPPVVRGPSALSRLAFSTPVGEVGGPVFESGQWFFLMVDGRPKPLRGDWSEVGQAVQASLDLRPIEDPEYWQWKEAIRDRYEVDTRPLLELVGEMVNQ